MEIEQNETWGSEGACVWCGDFDTHPHMVAQVRYHVWWRCEVPENTENMLYS